MYLVQTYYSHPLYSLLSDLLKVYLGKWRFEKKIQETDGFIITNYQTLKRVTPILHEFSKSNSLLEVTITLF